MPDKANALQKIVDQGLLPLFFYESAEVSLEIIKTLYRAGIRTLEYTNRGPAALENFTFLKHELSTVCPDLDLGIGTIKTTAEAQAFLKAGADYIVAPIINPAVANLVHEARVLWIPGCMSPTEIFKAQEHKAALIKVFPANILGAAFIASIKELFPGQLFMPTGGVELEAENLRSWFKAGVCAVGMGSKLISQEILAGRQYEVLYAQTRKALELVNASK
jgi:2-dehydro-3-deoxyphosphogluconate aldolase/(4S)-4-hydroxy-2-oxoglutarate aldolase